MKNLMLKGANIAVRLYIEGYDEPADDYAKLATEIAQHVLQLGIAAYRQEGSQFSVQVQSVKVLEGSDEEELDTGEDEEATRPFDSGPAVR